MPQVEILRREAVAMRARFDAIIPASSFGQQQRGPQALKLSSIARFGPF